MARKRTVDGAEQRLASELDVHGIPHVLTEASKYDRNGKLFLAGVVDVRVSALLEREAVAWVAPSADTSAQRVAWRDLGAKQAWSAKARKAARLAVRTAYALNLAKCAVAMRANHEGTLGVAWVLGTDAKGGGLADLAARVERVLFRDEAVIDERAGTIAPPPLMIGADPEFILMGQDGIVYADQFLGKHGVAGCDAVYIEGRRLYPLAEVRPAPAHEPYDLLRNTHRALRTADARIPDRSLRWLAGGLPRGGWPIGGHLHFSGLELSGETLRTLDNYLALPLWMLEDAQSTLRRPRFGYLGDHKEKPHGGFEYRTLSSWLVSPRIAAFVFALAKVVAEHRSMLKLRPLSREGAAAAFYQGDKSAFAAAVVQVWRDLESTTTYRRYRQWLEPMKHKVLSGIEWNVELDLRKTWKLG